MRKFEGGDYGVAVATRFPIINHTIFYYHPPSEKVSFIIAIPHILASSL